MASTVGAGPLADAMKKTPPNLTLLAKQNGGKFPATRVADTIRDGAIPGHGRKTMLEWGKVFGAIRTGWRRPRWSWI